MQKFKKGDVIFNTNTEKEIVRVYKNFYYWKYLFSDEIFDSRNSNDPLFEMEKWQLKTK